MCLKMRKKVQNTINSVEPWTTITQWYTQRDGEEHQQWKLKEEPGLCPFNHHDEWKFG